MTQGRPVMMHAFVDACHTSNAIPLDGPTDVFCDNEAKKRLKLTRFMLVLARRKAEPTAPLLTLPWDTTFNVAGGLVVKPF